jgi:hypothetical protein
MVGGNVAHTLTPHLEIGAGKYVMYTPELGSVPVAALRKFETNIESQRDTVVRALNFLFDGI